MQQNHFRKDHKIRPGEECVLLPLGVAKEKPKAEQPDGRRKRVSEQRLLRDEFDGRDEEEEATLLGELNLFGESFNRA